jgi:hypothetical protein
VRAAEERRALEANSAALEATAERAAWAARRALAVPEATAERAAWAARRALAVPEATAERPAWAARRALAVPEATAGPVASTRATTAVTVSGSRLKPAMTATAEARMDVPRTA